MIVKQFEAVIRKQKTETRRTSEKDTYKVGSTYAVVPKLGQPSVWWKKERKEDSVKIEIIIGHQPWFGQNWHQTRVLILEKHWEPLHAIMEEGAIAEGIVPVDATYAGVQHGILYMHRLNNMAFYTAVEAYRDLWDSINGKSKYRWDNNPKVCVHKFSLVEE